MQFKEVVGDDKLLELCKALCNKENQPHQWMRTPKNLVDKIYETMFGRDLKDITRYFFWRVIPTDKIILLSDALEKIENGEYSKKTAWHSYMLAQQMWADRLPKEDCFDFVRRLLNKLYELIDDNWK